MGQSWARAGTHRLAAAGRLPLVGLAPGDRLPHPWAHACTHPLLPPPSSWHPRRTPPTPEEQGLLREALLGDVEAGEGSASGGPNGPKRRKRSWITLVGVAAQYMWPDSLALQARMGRV